MQELTNVNYSETKLYSIFHIAYKVIEFSTNKKNHQLHSRSQYWNDNEAATDHGGFVAIHVRVTVDSLVQELSRELSYAIPRESKICRQSLSASV